MKCPIHDEWYLDKQCTCSAERKWAREKMLQENLEKIIRLRKSAPQTKVEETEND